MWALAADISSVPSIIALALAAAVAVASLAAAPRIGTVKRLREENADLSRQLAATQEKLGQTEHRLSEMRGRLDALERYAAPEAFREIARHQAQVLLTLREIRKDLAGPLREIRSDIHSAFIEPPAEDEGQA